MYINQFLIPFNSFILIYKEWTCCFMYSLNIRAHYKKKQSKIDIYSELSVGIHLRKLKTKTAQAWKRKNARLFLSAGKHFFLNSIHAELSQAFLFGAKIILESQQKFYSCWQWERSVRERSKEIFLSKLKRKIRMYLIWQWLMTWHIKKIKDTALALDGKD